MKTVMQLINPPPAVTDALENLRQACGGWLPTPVAIPHVPLTPQPSGPIDWHRSAMPAEACMFVHDPMLFVWHEAVLILPIVIALTALFMGLRLYRLPILVIKAPAFMWQMYRKVAAE